MMGRAGHLPDADLVTELLNGLAIALPSTDFWDDLQSAVTDWASGADLPCPLIAVAALVQHIRQSLTEGGWCIDEILGGEALAFQFSDALDLAEHTVLATFTPE